MSIRFYENPEKKQVIAAITLRDGTTVKARATCSPEDTYDYENGRRLAEARLKVKLAKRDCVQTVREYEQAQDESVALTKRLQKLNKLWAHNAKYLADRREELVQVYRELS